jgi:hypothetical protein
MTVPSAYLTSTKNTADVFASIQKAAVPEVFTHEFLKHLGFTSSADRPIIPVMKAIGFLDESGRPTILYRSYKDPALAKGAVAQGLRLGYADLFAIDTEANTKSVQQLTGMFGRLSDKGESVTQKMASTFKALAALADFSSVAHVSRQVDEPSTPPREGVPAAPNTEHDDDRGLALNLRHDIHVHLPLSTDVAVYDAIFRSLKANLL